MTKQVETHSFQAEVNEVLSIVVNSLYSHKEVFLRELISNASDALDHLSFRALTDHTLLAEDKELKIDLVPDKKAGTLTIRDNGIGMTREELIGNLGTIARSGSKKLMQSLSAAQKKDVSLIGQFGVGFYSAYLVADRVTVRSRAIGSSQAHQWESEAKGSFSVDECDKADRGTEIVLHLKEDEVEFLQEWNLRNLVRKYSDYVRHPIRLWVDREAEKKESHFETVNSARALWTRPKHEITKEQYAEFYKHLGHDWEEPIGWTHFKVEGVQELTGLIYLPKQAPMDLQDRKPKGVKLFVKRIFIMDECETIVPEWLRFVRGVVDSEDLPLNVSREILQTDRTSRLIKKQVTKHVLNLLEEIASEGETTTKDPEGKEEKRNRWLEIWSAHGRVLKEGIHLDPDNRDQIAKLLRFASTAVDGLTSLDQYVSRMKEGQPGIYYVTAESLDSARTSPHIEALKKRGFEVLLMVDPIDEWIVRDLGTFAEKKLIASTKGSLDLPESEAEKEQRKEKSTSLKGLLDKLEDVLETRVKEVRVTDRLTDSPACLVTDEHGLSPHLERILRQNGQDVPEQKRILELNADHPVVKKLQSMSADDQRSKEVADWTELLYDQALIAEGGVPKDPAAFARRLTQLMERG